MHTRAVWSEHSLFVDIYFSTLWVFKRTTKALISLCLCAGWAGPTLSANCINALFVRCASNYIFSLLRFFVIRSCLGHLASTGRWLRLHQHRCKRNLYTYNIYSFKIDVLSFLSCLRNKFFSKQKQFASLGTVLFFLQNRNILEKVSCARVQTWTHKSCLPLKIVVY